MKRILVLLTVAFSAWLGCEKTPAPAVEKPCVRVYDTATTVDNYTEQDTFSTFRGMKTLDFKLRIVKIASQTGTCVAEAGCSNLLTITNTTNKTVTIFYNLVGGPNVMIAPNSTKSEVVPVGVFVAPNAACFALPDLKNSMKVRYN